MNRSQILDEARQCVTQDRNSQYGEPEDSFGLVAAYWAAHLGHPVTASDVAVMLCQLKLARIKANPGKADSWVDGAGYLACGGEIATGQTTAHGWHHNDYTDLHRSIIGTAEALEGAQDGSGLFPRAWTPETDDSATTARAGGWDGAPAGERA